MTYIIKKSIVYPKGEIRWSGKPYLGMSMNNRIFHSQPSLSELLNFIKEHTDDFSVLVGDYLHRYNLQIFEGLNEADSINLVSEQSKALVDLFRETVKQNGNALQYHFLFTKDLKDHIFFNEKMKRFQSLHKTSKHFESLTEYTINIFLRRQNNIKVPMEKARELCRSYLFEELVIFEMLAENGYKVNIYPGNQLPIIKAIVSGQLKNISKPLESIQAVEIKFRPK